MGSKRIKPWIGVDFDGTLARHYGWVRGTHTGTRIPTMVRRVKAWLRAGKKVRIFTARVYAHADSAKEQREAAHAILAIQNWCVKHLGRMLPITYVKDYGMVKLWDDRAQGVTKNRGGRK